MVRPIVSATGTVGHGVSVELDVLVGEAVMIVPLETLVTPIK
jgi:hypothetical protein